MRWWLDHHEEKRITMSNAGRFAILLALGSLSVAQADELGRLFFSQEDRHQLDQHHAPGAAAKDRESAQPFIVVNGVIQHNNGSRTVWINGRVQHNSPGKNPNTVTVTVPGKDESVEVKVGQRLMIDNIPSPQAETSSLSK
jgi:hypothetical protein